MFLIFAPVDVCKAVTICSSTRRIDGTKFVFSKSLGAKLEKIHAVLFSININIAVGN
jgi:hypothetical protein